jgi:hypothetical protein
MVLCDAHLVAQLWNPGLLGNSRRLYIGGVVVICLEAIFISELEMLSMGK